MDSEALEGLNAEQQAAVEHNTGPLLVVAGAGTGKTRVITRRIAHLIRSGRAKPAQILALTFTEKAAREMEDRLYELVGWQSFQVPVMTFNAFGSELLGRFASHIGRSVRGGLLNETQKALLLQQHIDRIELRYYGPQADMFEFLEGIVTYIGQLQNAGVRVDAYEAYVAALERDRGGMHPQTVVEQADLARLFRLYEELKLETGTFDYHDQLQAPVEMLHQRPNLAEQLEHEYRYILVDEYQDTNPVQDQLLRAFIPKSGNLFVVGDDDQAIYGFRGADIRNILNFSQHFDVDKPVTLIRNYRSGQPILDAAYRMIVNNNPERLEARLGLNKSLISERAEADVQFVPYANNHEELEAVADSIAARIAAGEPADEIAVLAAQHAPLSALGALLRRRSLPFALSTRVNIFEQPELIGLWYLLRWLAWQADESVIGHVLMGPIIGWSPEQYRKLLELSRDQLMTLEEVLRLDESEGVREFTTRLDQWREWAQTLPVSQLVYRLVFETGLAEAWQRQAEQSPRMVRVFEDLQRWLEQMQDFETIALTTTLSEYTRTFPKPPVLEVNEPLGDITGVQLLTVHASKGLEFDTVYVVGCTQRAWSPGHMAGREVPLELRGDNGLPPEHEFRRLMYVAATRARQALILSAATGTIGGTKQSVSRIAAELFEGAELPVAGMQGEGDGGLLRVMKDLQRFYPLRAAFGQEDRLPFESADGTLELTVTGLAAYEFCPFEFYLGHVLQIKQPIGPQLSFGTVLHQVFERYYKALLAGRPVASGEPEAWLDELWSDRGYERREVAQADLQLAHQTLARFLVREQATIGRELEGSEVPILIDVPEARLRLRGKIDAIFTIDGGVELRDFKTGRTKTDPAKLAQSAKENFQLRSYALAFEMLNGKAPAQVVLDYVVTGVEGAAQLSSTILRNHRARLGTFADRIRAREFAPNPSAMHQCAAIRFYGTGEREELFDSMREQV